MSALTEREIFSRMEDSFRSAIDLCDRMARGERGSCYRLLRGHLGTLENTFRQAGWWRDDARWLSYSEAGSEVQRYQYDDTGIMSLIWVVSKAHASAGLWLREKHPSWKFAQLANVLRAGQKAAEELRTKATGRLGTILPAELPAPHRDTRPVQVKTPSGIIIPLGPSGRVH